MSINGKSFHKKDWAKVGVAVAALAAPWVVPALAGGTAAVGAAGAAGAGAAGAGAAGAGIGGGTAASLMGAAAAPAAEHALASSLMSSAGTGLLGGSAAAAPGVSMSMFGPTAAGAELMGTYAPYVNAATTPNPLVSFQDAWGRGSTQDKLNALQKMQQQFASNDKRKEAPPMLPMPQRQQAPQTDIEKLLAMMYPIIHRS